MQFSLKLKNAIIIFSHIIKEKVLKLKWYSWKRESYNITAVALVDGKFYSGGLTDRFKGIVSLYAWAKSRNIPFRIEYTYPFPLIDYLVPNKVDWIIRRGDCVRTLNAADIILSVGEPTVIKRLNKKRWKRQIHFYGNRDLLDSMNIPSAMWGSYYKELFKPAERLNKTLKSVKEMVGSNYFSVVFRFQNLLGDFPEYNFKPLDSELEKQKLINACLFKIDELKSFEKGKTCLVTSDSSSFLDSAQRLEGVKIIPGKLVHLGSNDNGNYEQYEKSFVDFYMLSESTKIYSVVCGDMYPSEFPLYAANINNIPFERITIKK